MMTRILMLGAALIATAACNPLVVGGAAVVGADAIIEHEQGGDGLF